jgi:hypothetical protein
MEVLVKKIVHKENGKMLKPKLVILVTILAKAVLEQKQPIVTNVILDFIYIKTNVSKNVQPDIILLLTEFVKNVVEIAKHVLDLKIINVLHVELINTSTIINVTIHVQTEPIKTNHQKLVKFVTKNVSYVKEVQLLNVQNVIHLTFLTVVLVELVQNVNPKKDISVMSKTGNVLFVTLNVKNVKELWMIVLFVLNQESWSQVQPIMMLLLFSQLPKVRLIRFIIKILLKSLK